MSEHSVFVRPNGAPIEADRATVRLSVHYQEYDSPTTHLTVAYDRTVPAENKPHQIFQRVGFEPVEIDIGRLSWGSVELALMHHKAKLGKIAASPAVAEAQNENRILLLDAELKEIGFLLPDHASLFYFSKPIFVKSTHTTALLHVTALPLL